jgi:hypothetical protein
MEINSGDDFDYQIYREDQLCSEGNYVNDYHHDLQNLVEGIAHDYWGRDPNDPNQFKVEIRVFAENKWKKFDVQGEAVAEFHAEEL